MLEIDVAAGAFFELGTPGSNNGFKFKHGVTNQCPWYIIICCQWRRNLHDQVEMALQVVSTFLTGGTFTSVRSNVYSRVRYTNWC